MLGAVILFFILAVVAAVLGFTGVAVAFASIAKILFFLFVILFIVSLFMHLTGTKNKNIYPPQPPQQHRK